MAAFSNDCCSNCASLFKFGGKSIRLFELNIACVFEDVPPNLLYFMNSSVPRKIILFDQKFTSEMLTLKLLSINYESCLSIGKEKNQNYYYRPFEAKKKKLNPKWFGDFFSKIIIGDYESIVSNKTITTDANKEEEKRKCYDACKDAEEFKTIIATNNVYCYPLKASSFAIRPTIMECGTKSIILYSILFLCNLCEEKVNKEEEEEEEEEKKEEEEEFSHHIINTKDNDLVCSNLKFLKHAEFHDDYGGDQPLVRYLNALNTINIFSFHEPSSSFPPIFKKIINNEKGKKYSVLGLILKNSKLQALSKTSLSFQFLSTEFQKTNLSSIHRKIFTDILIDLFILIFYSKN
nr:MAG: hypothetical protein [Porcellio scaber clopovirus]